MRKVWEMRIGMEAIRIDIEWISKSHILELIGFDMLEEGKMVFGVKQGLLVRFSYDGFGHCMREWSTC